MLKRIISSLYFQVILGALIGVLLGYFYPNIGLEMKPFGDAFIKLIKMIIAPIIFCTVVSGIAGMDSMKTVGKTGVFALIYFEIVSTLALIIGLIMVNYFKPGLGININLSQLNPNDIAIYTANKSQQSLSGFFLNIIPNTFVDAFSKGDILQVLFLSILFSFSMHALGSKARLILEFINKISFVFFGMVQIIMRVAPIGAFGALAFTISEYGLGTLLSLGKLMGTFYLTCLIFIFFVLGIISRSHGFSIWKLIKYIKEELLIVLSTSSSESVLPRMIAKMENLGVSKSTVGLLIPAGYSFNLDGTSIYLTMAVVFIAQATNTPLDIAQQLSILVVLLLTSKGAAGVTGSGFIVLAATLGSVSHIPVEGLAIILGIDRFMSEARALTNLIGNAVATIVVGKWCGQVNNKRLTEHLKHESFNESNDPENLLR